MPTMQSTAPTHFVRPLENWLRWVFGVFGLLGITLLFCWFEARLPNFDLTFSRTVPSHESFSSLSERVRNVSEWTNWFYAVKSVTVTNGDRQLHPGADVLFEVDPGKGSNRKFQIAARVTDFQVTPDKVSLELHVLDDSSGKIFRIVDQLDWHITLEQTKEGVEVSGIEKTHTAHWRSRLFGRIAPRSILNQLFYPNLMWLADPKRALDRGQGLGFM